MWKTAIDRTNKTIKNAENVGNSVTDKAAKLFKIEHLSKM